MPDDQEQVPKLPAQPLSNAEKTPTPAQSGYSLRWRTE